MLLMAKSTISGPFSMSQTVSLPEGNTLIGGTAPLLVVNMSPLFRITKRTVGPKEFKGVLNSIPFPCWITKINMFHAHRVAGLVNECTRNNERVRICLGMESPKIDGLKPDWHIFIPYPMFRSTNPKMSYCWLYKP